MSGLTPRALPLTTKMQIDRIVSEAVKNLHAQLKQSDGLRLTLHEEGGKLTLYAMGAPLPLNGFSQEILCENAISIQELYLRARSGGEFGWSQEGFVVAASSGVVECVEEFLRKEGLLEVRYGLMVLPEGFSSSDLKTNELVLGRSINHPMDSPESWFATPWDAKRKAEYVSDVVKLMTGEPLNLSYCYAYFCEIELFSRTSSSVS